jgi:hypothetical protein
MVKNINLMGYCFKLGSPRAQIKTTWKHFENWRLLSYRIFWKMLPASSNGGSVFRQNVDNDVSDSESPS